MMKNLAHCSEQSSEQNAEHSVQRSVEQICIQGCESVRQTIERLETHQPINMIKDLSPQECNEVLHELREIMSIYDYR